jgi:hypothetical protein
LKNLVLKISMLLVVSELALFTGWKAGAADLLQNYRDATDRCAGMNVRKLDDKITSAAIIGDVLLEQCKAANLDLWTAATRGKSEAYKSGYLEAQRKQFITYVLLHRTGGIK